MGRLRLTDAVTEAVIEAVTEAVTKAVVAVVKTEGNTYRQLFTSP